MVLTFVCPEIIRFSLKAKRFFRKVFYFDLVFFLIGFFFF